MTDGGKRTEPFSQNGNDNNGGVVEECSHHAENYKIVLDNWREGSKQHLAGSS